MFRTYSRQPGAQGSPSQATSTQGFKSSKGWIAVFEKFKEVDAEEVKNMEKYIDTLLVFAGLFSAVLTAFLVPVYAELQPQADTTQLNTQVLIQLSNQIYKLSLDETAPPTNVSFPSTPSKPLASTVAVTSLWFLSLILSLGSAMFGILVKQWLREYLRWAYFPSRDAVHLRYYRKGDMEKWRIDGIITVLSDLLELGLVLFLIGLVILLWHIHVTVAVLATLAIFIVLIPAFTMSILPVFVRNCAYRTSIASTILVVALWLKSKSILVYGLCRSMVYKPFEPSPTARDENFQPEADKRFENWVQWDQAERLRKNSPNSTIKHLLSSLSQLVGHSTIPENTIAECLLDLSSPPKSQEEEFVSRSEPRFSYSRSISGNSSQFHTGSFVIELFLLSRQYTSRHDSLKSAQHSNEGWIRTPINYIRQILPNISSPSRKNHAVQPQYTGEELRESERKRSNFSIADDNSFMDASDFAFLWPGISKWLEIMARNLYKEMLPMNRTNKDHHNFLDKLLEVLILTEEGLDTTELCASCYPLLGLLLSREETDRECVLRLARVKRILNVSLTSSSFDLTDATEYLDTRSVVWFMRGALITASSSNQPIDTNWKPNSDMINSFWVMAFVVFTVDNKKQETKDDSFSWNKTYQTESCNFQQVVKKVLNWHIDSKNELPEKLRNKVSISLQTYNKNHDKAIDLERALEKKFI